MLSTKVIHAESDRTINRRRGPAPDGTGATNSGSVLRDGHRRLTTSPFVLATLQNLRRRRRFATVATVIASDIPEPCLSGVNVVLRRTASCRCRCRLGEGRVTVSPHSRPAVDGSTARGRDGGRTACDGVGQETRGRGRAYVSPADDERMPVSAVAVYRSTGRRRQVAIVSSIRPSRPISDHTSTETH